MQVSTIIDYVAMGDLKQTSLSDIGTTAARTEQQQRNLDTLIGFVNQGVLELHKRFPILVQVETEKFSRPTEADDPYVLPDTAIELVKIVKPDGEEAYLDNYDVEARYKANVYKEYYVKTVAVNSYRVLGTLPTEGVVLEFHYKAAPAPVGYSGKLSVPVMYHEALMNYVAYRGFSTIQSVTPIGDTGLNYKKKFEDSCLRIEQNTDTLYEWANPKRLVERGFV